MKKAASSPKTVKEPPTRTIRQSVMIAATPVEVYDPLVNAKKHAAFTGAAAKSSDKVGGKFTAWDGYITGKYLNLVAGRKIVEEWSTNDWPEGYGPSLIELTFERAENGTRLKMVHSRVPANQAAQYRQGWKNYYWTPLRKYFPAKSKTARK